MKLIYGTGNPAKFDSMKRALSGLPIELYSLADCNVALPEITEAGDTPLANARIKAHAYYEALKRPVFSCDSGLYAANLPSDRQIGLRVRVVNGKSLTDDEMIAHYSGLAREFGDLECRYKNGVCFIFDESHIYESDADDLSGDPFIICSKPHKKRVPGFPLDCLSVDIKTGRYCYDLEQFQTDEIAVAGGFCRFFGAALADICAKR